MIIAARLAPLPMTNDGDVTLVACHWRPELTALSNVTRVTVSATVVVRVKPPLTPLIVSVYVPTGVLSLVVTENVDEVVAGFGVKLPPAAAGNPLTVNVTWPVNPLIGVIATG
jgi:hypothetical protein